MNPTWTRPLKSAFRREPISSFLFIAGIVDAVIGGGNAYWTLMALGLGTATLALVLRWWMMQQRSIEPVERGAIRYLPPSRSPRLP